MYGCGPSPLLRPPTAQIKLGNADGNDHADDRADAGRHEDHTRRGFPRKNYFQVSSLYSYEVFQRFASSMVIGSDRVPCRGVRAGLGGREDKLIISSHREGAVSCISYMDTKGSAAFKQKAGKEGCSSLVLYAEFTNFRQYSHSLPPRYDVYVLL